MGAATLASRILGLVRDVVLANVFAKSATDAFFIAFMVPNLLRRLIGEGALTLAFVPVFTGALRQSRPHARHVFNATWTLTLIVALVLAGLGMWAAEPLARLFAPGFAEVPGKLELCARLLWWCFPYVVCLSWVAVAMGALNATGHFLSPALAPVLLNAALIGAALLFAQAFDPPVLALGAGVVVAGGLQVVAQLPALRRRELAPRFAFAPRQKEVRTLVALMGPAALGASVYQLNLFVVRVLASFQGEGAVSYLYYADRLMELPLGVFVFGLGMASLPSFSALAKSGDADGLRGAFAGTLTLTLALALPSTVGLIVLREEIFWALFAWNAELFDAQAVAACGRALFAYALGLGAIATSRIVAQLCIAHENTRTPARAAVVSLVANVAFGLALIGPLPLGGPLGALARGWQDVAGIADLGYAGLALATSLAATANAAFLALAARRRYGRLFVGEDWRELGKIVVASLAMGAAVLGVVNLLPAAGSGKLAGLVTLGAGVASGALAYAAVLAALASRELATLWRTLRRG